MLREYQKVALSACPDSANVRLATVHLPQMAIQRQLERLAPRKGPRPATKCGIPHIQLTQWPSPVMVEQLAQRTLLLPQVRQKESQIADPSVRAIWIPDELSRSGSGIFCMRPRVLSSAFGANGMPAPHSPERPGPGGGGTGLGGPASACRKGILASGSRTCVCPAEREGTRHGDDTGRAIVSIRHGHFGRSGSLNL